MMSQVTPSQIVAARAFIKGAVRLIEDGSNEQVIRDHFTSQLRVLFPETPSWIVAHIAGGEAALKTRTSDAITTSFVDNLIGHTPIEYESNLHVPAKFSEGFDQVRKYCASLLTGQTDPTRIVGILSDTVRWFAYGVIVKAGRSEPFEADDVELFELDSIDVSAASDVDARRLIEFLLKYLQRIGSRPLEAPSIARDLGFESPFCEKHFLALQELVKRGFSARPEYAKLIKELWCNFVSYVIAKGKASDFDEIEYTRELYILTLGKLICANAIESRSLISDDTELGDILSGEFFQNRGLENFVEYDYFGWINWPGQFQQGLTAVARQIQFDLRAYDFSGVPNEDIFGHLMAQLAKRSRRILLGQEWTPTWLARELVRNTLAKLPDRVAPRFIDMCCGSGSMIMETVRQVKQRIEGGNTRLTESQRLAQLTQAITGFDIDPLAVMLSKISWVLSAKDWLQPFGTQRVTIPIYHADSLFATTPLSREPNSEAEKVTLHLAEYSVELPTVLISTGWQRFFDSIVDRAYAIATNTNEEVPSKEELTDMLNVALRLAPKVVRESEKEGILEFLIGLIDRIHKLSLEGRNGIWAYILRNNYRPGLVAGQFNGLVSNPPWLALSKIADNPYKEALQRMADLLGIRPVGSSFLHLEMSPIFLLRSIDRYLQDGAVFGCIVPETVLNGYQHNLFRAGGFSRVSRPVSLSIDEIWKVDVGAFKNRAAVLFGQKVSFQEWETVSGQYISQNGILHPREFKRVVLGSKVVWSDHAGVDTETVFHPADFEQGADIMPRTLFFHEVTRASKRTVNLGPITRGKSGLSYLISDAKKLKTFKLSVPCVVHEKYIFPVLLSKMLSPFHLEDPAMAFLPIKKNNKGEWVPVSELDLSQDANDASALRAFKQIGKEIAKMDRLVPSAIFEGMWNRLNFRNKIGKQAVINGDGYLVVTGAGGSDLCAAYLDLRVNTSGKLLIDQTLYWTIVSTEEEALYLTGLLNSEAANNRIKAFQPRGQQGERHIHELGFGITPPFNPDDSAHLEVVKTTKNLLNDYAAFIDSKKTSDESKLLQWLDPGKSLAKRRSKLREAIENLPSYSAYSSACSDVYGA